MGANFNFGARNCKAELTPAGILCLERSGRLELAEAKDSGSPTGNFRRFCSMPTSSKQRYVDSK